MPTTVPLASQEVRWFFEGPANSHQPSKQWHETVAPLPKRGEVGPPQWKGRLDGQPDIYLLVSGGDDMGIGLALRHRIEMTDVSRTKVLRHQDLRHAFGTRGAGLQTCPVNHKSSTRSLTSATVQTRWKSLRALVAAVFFP